MSAEVIIQYGIVGLMWGHSLWELYLRYNQHRVCITVVQVPSELAEILPADVYERSRLYAREKNCFSMCETLYNTLLGTSLVWFQGLLYFWRWAGTIVNTIGLHQSEIVLSAVFVLVTYPLYTLCNLPVDIWIHFVLEEKYGFNQQTLKFYAKDKLKSFVLSQIILIILSIVVVYIIEVGGNYFFLYLWLFMTGAVLFGLTVYADYIAPLFDKYTPLPAGELRTRIEQLAASVHFPLYKIYVVEGSAHSNAYFYGFYKNKRIVLFDTLLKDRPATASGGGSKGCNNDEIVGVVAHELGHWKLNHVSKQLAISLVNSLLQFLVFGVLYKNETLYNAFGFRNEKPVLIGLFIVACFVFLPYNALAAFGTYCLSRRFEFQADAFAKSLGMAAHLRSALIKLCINNLSFPVFDPLYTMGYHSHPPLLKRLEALDKAD